jgi:hypothetical protein
VLTPLNDQEMDKVRMDFPRLPEDYFRYMEEFGYGQTPSGTLIQRSPIWPQDVFFRYRGDRNRVLIGRDVTGRCLGYDFDEGRFGEYSESGDWTCFDRSFDLLKRLNVAWKRDEKTNLPIEPANFGIELINARNAGEVRFSFVTEYSGDMNRVLAKLGLAPDRAGLIELDRATAVAIFAGLLQEDMAYGSPIMPEEDAKTLAERTLSLHETSDSRYFSNRSDMGSGRWHDFTGSTFDSGLIVMIHANLFLGVWFEDED